MKETPTSRTIDRLFARSPERSRELVEGWSTAPSGGLLKMLILGIGLPLWIYLAFAHGIFESGHATWHGRGAGLDVYGTAAYALGTSIAGVALFCHARWFWGLVPSAVAYALGTVVSLAMVAGGIGVAAWSVMAF